MINLNINDILFDEIKATFSLNYTLSDNSIHNLEVFLKKPEPFFDRQNNAINIIKNVMSEHNKRDLFEYLAELARVEFDSRNLAPRHRDHVVHAVLSFILGIYLSEKVLKPSDIKIEPFQWKLASLFHDIGYPVQVANNYLLKPYEENINKMRKSLGVKNEKLHFEIAMHGFENLTNNANSFDLIDNRLCDWGIKINSKEVCNRILKSGKIDHGIISSLTLLNVIDLMYQKYNPNREYINPDGNVKFNQKYFDCDVVSACSAIYIHNLDSSYLPTKIDRSRAPLAFLLRLSDCLQEWERPSLQNPTGFPSEQFNIEIDNGDLIFHARISDNKKDEIKNEISSSLICQDVHIL